MKGKITSFIVLFTFILLSSCTDNNTGKVDELVKSLSMKYIPDRRTDICNIVTHGSRNGIVLKGETTVPDFKSELISTITKSHIQFIDSILILPDTTSSFRGLVTLSVTNLRKEPGHASEMISQALLGTPVIILKKEDSWSLVKTPDGYLGWLESSSVADRDFKDFENWRKAPKLVFTNRSGWIFSDIDLKEVISDIVAGGIIEETGGNKEIAAVRFPDGRTGFVKRIETISFGEFLKIIPEESRIIETASGYMGIPYLWGGASSKGADCSGFVQNVYFRNGIILQRDASMQALHGIDVDTSGNFRNLRPGDLLFFGRPQRIWHVGIYTGAGKYINSAVRVKINSLFPDSSNFSKSRRQTLVKVKRIIGASDNGIIPVGKHPWF